jgi:hypothetical protein
LADVDVPTWGDDSNITFDELIARVDKSLDFLRSVDGSVLAAGDNIGLVHHQINEKLGSIDVEMKDFLLAWSVPMFFCKHFHSNRDRTAFYSSYGNSIDIRSR